MFLDKTQSFFEKARQNKTLIVVFLVLFLPLLGILSFNLFYQEAIYPNIKIGTVPVGGLTKVEARQKMRSLTNPIINEGIQYTYKDFSTIISSTVVGKEDIDSSYPLITYEIEKAIDQAFLLGREGSLFMRLSEQLTQLISSKSIPISYYLNEEELHNILKSEFSHLETLSKDASFTFDAFYNLQIEKENSGAQFDYVKAIEETRKIVKNLDKHTVNLSIYKTVPLITEDVIKAYETQIKQVLVKNPMTLTFKERKWNLYKQDFKNWLTLKQKPSSAQGKVVFNVIFSEEKITNYLNEIGEEITVKPKNARFEIAESGKVSEFQGSQSGLELNISDTIKTLNENILNQEKKSLSLIMEETFPEIETTKELNDLGIKEIIGVGISDFSGSPANRIHNIQIGANALHGILLDPDEEFSLIKTLGTIDGTSGYKKELVIKGDKTIAEYGGGLCQIGTTTFRAALESGLPITERRNHSYRVSYYEPAGTDATIYSPKPDFRFLNDTGRHVLIQTKIDGDLLIFEFWGTRDGRTVEKTQPIIYNITPPPPTKLIETTELPPGQKKCTERAHNGADAKFDYNVTYRTGEIVEKTFYSHYIPWQEVCLIGVDPEEKKKDDEEAKKAIEEELKIEDENTEEEKEELENTEV